MTLAARMKRLEGHHSPARVHVFWADNEAEADEREAQMAAAGVLGPNDTVVRMMFKTVEDCPSAGGSLVVVERVAS